MTLIYRGTFSLLVHSRLYACPDRLPLLRTLVGSRSVDLFSFEDSFIFEFLPGVPFLFLFSVRNSHLSSSKILSNTLHCDLSSHHKPPLFPGSRGSIPQVKLRRRDVILNELQKLVPVINYFLHKPSNCLFHTFLVGSLV